MKRVREMKSIKMVYKHFKKGQVYAFKVGIRYIIDVYGILNMIDEANPMLNHPCDM